jgi:hypothetical protein
MASHRRKAADALTAFLQDTGAAHRQVADGEWGLALNDVGGAPLEIGLRIDGELLAAQAWVAPPGAVDPHSLLHRHRRTRLVRYTHSAAGDVHVQAELPLAAVDARWLDRLLSGLVEAAELARQAAAAGPPARGS